jgi:anti-anti-sigma regulatory factor
MWSAKEKEGREVETTTGMRPVAVRHMPDILSVQQKVAFLHDIAGTMNTSRPRLVLDCAKLRECNTSTIHLLLHCLEEAMKRNGDVKLAAVPTHAAVMLVSTGVARLFETYDTTEEAVASFHRLPVPAEKPPSGSEKAA